MGRMTLWGMQQIRPTLLQGVSLPQGMDREAFLQMMDYRVGAQYPRTQVPEILEGLITSWFRLRGAGFQRMYDALTAEYSPIENYDRTEERTDKLTHSGRDTDTNELGTSVTLKRTGTEEMAQSGTESRHTSGTDKTVQSGSDTTETQVSAYDADSYVPREKQTRSPGVTDLRTPDLTEMRTPDLRDVRTPNLTDVSTNSGADTKTTDYGHIEDRKETIRAHGNIGVTTNQQMIEAEVQMRIQWDMTDIIIGMFEQEFLSRVY